MMNKNILLLARSELKYDVKRLLLENKTAIDAGLKCFYNKQELIMLQMKIEKEVTSSNKCGCKMISILDDDYPEALKKIPEAPIILTIKGNKKILQDNLFAIVGSRKIEDFDYNLIKKIADIANSVGAKIVSGLARGSDIVAHMQSVKAGTIAILPCGLNYCYPKEHEKFCQMIIDNGGLIVSDYPFFEEVKQRNFIRRNRIITGLAKAVFIGRCDGLKTGTMSSARFAQKQERKIYTYDFGKNCIGNRYLIDNKIAKKVENLQSFKRELLKDF